ncbi:hypothetical protein ACTUSR_08205 [Pantoea stewartii subsp. indologenes]|uniref:hypothetical protein n=1 Tax=Pantoea stewartii TaxID=66269 RepID=UPI003FA49B23
MTTSSPNRDVQALIADCQAEIEDLKRSIDRCDAIGTTEYLYQLQSKLKRQYAALDSLTAKPEYNVSFEGGEIRLDVTKAEYNGCHPDYRWISYPAPPAQLLRPVELPESFYGVIQNGKAVMLPADDGQWLNKTAVKELIVSLGYEVKS